MNEAAPLLGPADCARMMNSIISANITTMTMIGISSTHQPTVSGFCAAKVKVYSVGLTVSPSTFSYTLFTSS